jgi:[ribosomal protein S5]-alanine N-acetyltransferase
MQMQKLRTKRLTLVPQSIDHAEQLFELFQDEELYPFINRVPPASLQKFRDGIEFLVARREEIHDELWLNWVMVHADSNQLVGQVEVSLNSKTRDFYLAYTTFKGYWRQGFAKEACAEVIHHMFRDWKATRAIIEMDIRNTASVQLAQSLGALRVAFTPRAQELKGEWSDEYRYEICREVALSQSILDADDGTVQI